MPICHNPNFFYHLPDLKKHIILSKEAHIGAMASSNWIIGNEAEVNNVFEEIDINK